MSRGEIKSYFAFCSYEEISAAGFCCTGGSPPHPFEGVKIPAGLREQSRRGDRPYLNAWIETAHSVTEKTPTAGDP
jgi:hypothetical protein